MSLFLIGACFGSFLCLVAERLPVGRSLWWPPSHCQGCHQPLQLYELIPVVSAAALSLSKVSTASS
ncbi:TPA: prepilin peptidase [Enterococcus faecalis]|nr:prepilin peptidase [Enterococcus faecalis]